jgi:oxygen-dependent protoporphyrinogen oxidase
MTDRAADVIVIGGGLAGLACAWRLYRHGVDVVVVERSSAPGGNVRSEEVDGFLLERGPHTVLASAQDVFQLADEVGAGDELLASRPAAQARHIVRGGRLHAAPSGPISFLTTGLLSLRSKLELATEPLRTRRGSIDDSAATFFARRFGKEAADVLAGAFISGVYAGDPEQLQAAAAFPLFWGFEVETGSMIRGALRYRKRQRADRRRLGADAPAKRSGLHSFRRGLGQLSESVAAALGQRCQLGCGAIEAAAASGGFTVTTSTGTIACRRLVVATPPHDATGLLSGIDAQLGSTVGEIPMGPVAVVQLGFAERRSEIPESFGFLVPRCEGLRTLGVLFPSRIFEGRTPPGGELLAGFVGGTTDPGALDLTDTELSDIVRTDLANLTGLEAEPQLVDVTRWPNAIPQLVHGHLERMATVERRLHRLPGLVLAGNWLQGVGLKDAVRSGIAAARTLLDDSSPDSIGAGV